jgi:hypothetical protein
VKNTIVTDILVFKNRIQTAAVKRLIFSQIRDTMHKVTVLKHTCNFGYVLLLLFMGFDFCDRWTS